MQYVENGPVLPDSLLGAHESGKLVLFCGAGVSVPAGLPLFAGLVRQVQEALGTVDSGGPATTEQHVSLDRVLGDLEDERGANALRREVANVLATPTDPDLRTHEAIIDLSRDSEGVVRLVTTNFDRLFEEKAPDLPSYSAPALPVPKPSRWQGIVHIHGALSIEPDHSGDELVLTSADFGIAYLVEAWAANFFTELVRNYAVLFVGYQAEDPVMRYLCDALDAERRAGRARDVYALAPSATEAAREATADRWRAKRIEPLVYVADDDHSVLHETLRSWAEEWRGGLRVRQERLVQIAKLEPAAAPEHAVRQICRYVTSSTALARTFADQESAAPINWLPVFADRGVLEAVKKSPVGHAELVAAAPPSKAALNESQFHLARWMAAHSRERELIRWVIEQGGVLHPMFAAAIRKRVAEEPEITDGQRALWAALTDIEQIFVANAWVHDALSRVDTEPWSSSLRQAVLTMLEPKLQFRPPWRSVPIDDNDSDSLRMYAHADCRLHCGQMTSVLLARLHARTTWDDDLLDLSVHLSMLLGRALNRLEAADLASRHWDPSHFERPDIGSGQRRHGEDQWPILIDLTVNAIAVAAQRSQTHLLAILQILKLLPYPCACRILLHSARSHGTPSHEELTNLMSDDVDLWVWSLSSQSDLLAALPEIYSNATRQSQNALAQAILAGPPRDAFRADLEDEEWEAVRDEMVWERLCVLRDSASGLSHAPALDRLEEIEYEHPEWGEPHAARPSIEVSDSDPQARPARFTVSELRQESMEDIVRLVTREDTLQHGNLETFQGLFASDSGEVLVLLRGLIDLPPDDVPDQVWEHALEGARVSRVAEESPAATIAALTALPDAAIVAACWSVSEMLKVAAPELASELDDGFWTLWRRVFQSSTASPVLEADPLTAALNHPAGKLATTALEVLRARVADEDARLHDDVRSALEAVLASGSEPGRFARAIVASRIPLLHSLDPTWTTDHVLPLLDWSRPGEAVGAWQGFLWSALVPPALWERIQGDFLATFNHSDRLPDQAAQRISELLAAIMVLNEGALEPSDSRACLIRAGDQGRRVAAHWILQRVNRAETDDVDRLWTEELARIFGSIWPETSDSTPSVSAAFLAEIAASTVEAFPEAVQTMLPLLSFTDCVYGVLETLRERDHPRKHPEASLLLLNAIVPSENLDPSFRDLRATLERLEAARPDLARRTEFVRLMDAAIEAGQ